MATERWTAGSYAVLAPLSRELGMQTIDASGSSPTRVRVQKVAGRGRSNGHAPKALAGRGPTKRFLGPALVLYGVLFIVPVLGGIPLSLTQWSGEGPLRFVGLANFRSIFSSPALAHALEHNVVLFLTLLVLSNVVGLGLALAIEERPPGYKILRILIFLPAVMSLVATGFIWTLMLDPTIGFVNATLRDIGIHHGDVLWLASPKLALWTVIFVSWWQWGGIPMVIYSAGLKSIPRELLDAARVDGATGWRRLRGVIFPLLRPAVVVTTILTFVTSVQVFSSIYVLEGIEGAPGGATDVVGTLIYRDAFGVGTYSPQSNLGFAEANALIVVLLFAAVLLGMYAYFRRRVVEY